MTRLPSRYNAALVILLFEVFKTSLMAFILIRHGFLLRWYLIPVASGILLGFLFSVPFKGRNLPSLVLDLFIFLWFLLETIVSRFCMLIRGSEALQTLESCFRYGQLSRTFLSVLMITLVIKLGFVPPRSRPETAWRLGKGLSFDLRRDWPFLFLIGLLVYTIYKIFALK